MVSVGHAQALVIRILGLQPSGNLLGRPVQDQFTRNDVPQLAVAGKEALLRSQGRVPSSTIRIKGAIGRTATMARNLPAHGGGRAELSRRAISRSGESEAIPREMSSRSASVSASRERRRAAGGMPPRGNNTERMQLCGLSKARPISCKRLSRLPPAPNVTLLTIAESPNRCHCPHANTTFTQQTLHQMVLHRPVECTADFTRTCSHCDDGCDQDGQEVVSRIRLRWSVEQPRRERHTETQLSKRTLHFQSFASSHSCPQGRFYVVSVMQFQQSGRISH